jgi:hypothetical protein
MALARTRSIECASSPMPNNRPTVHRQKLWWRKTRRGSHRRWDANRQTSRARLLEPSERTGSGVRPFRTTTKRISPLSPYEAASYIKRRLSATVAEGSRTVKLTALFRRSVVIPYWVDCDEEAAVFGLDPPFKPRWRKIETEPSPLSAVTSPGSSTSVLVTRYSARANGPAFVR